MDSSKVTLRRTNTLLSIVLILLALYIIVWPFLPSLSWWARYDAPVISGIAKPNVNRSTIPDTNTLVIPSLGLQEAIHEGESEHTVNKGVWHRPGSSSPDQGSNTVLVGHRFTYSGKSVFYNLDKVRAGDEILLYWDDKSYTYKVESTIVLPPEAVEVEAPTDDAVLTLYTCTPLLTAKDRLVVRARLQ
jgi:sortase A